MKGKISIGITIVIQDETQRREGIAASGERGGATGIEKLKDDGFVCLIQVVTVGLDVDAGRGRACRDGNGAVVGIAGEAISQVVVGGCPVPQRPIGDCHIRVGWFVEGDDEPQIVAVVFDDSI